jgi:hypothetical protein
MNLLHRHHPSAANHCRRPAIWPGALVALAVLGPGLDSVADQWLSDRVHQAVWTQAAELPTEVRPPTSLLPLGQASGELSRDTRAPAVIPAGSFAQQDGLGEPVGLSEGAQLQPLPNWLDRVSVGYDRGFVVASGDDVSLDTSDVPFLMRMRAYAQLRYTHFDSEVNTPDLNQFQLIRGRVIISGNAFAPTMRYYVQFDGRSSLGDEFRFLDYYLDFDFGRHYWGLAQDALVFKAGQYKVPFTMARELSARQLEFTDRSMASMFFDVNRSQAWGLLSRTEPWGFPLQFETALFNGLVTGGTETGSGGQLDNKFAYVARMTAYPVGEWGTGALADFDWHTELAMRMGAAYAGTTVQRDGAREFDVIRVVDSGERLSALLPLAVDQFAVNMFCVDTSYKYRGWSVSTEYYFRTISGFRGANVPELFDHGFWLQVGKFVIPGKFQVLSRWSRVVGKSGTLGAEDQSADEIALGTVWYFRGENVRFTTDLTHVNGAPIRSTALDMFPGDAGWLLRSQIQFGF